MAQSNETQKQRDIKATVDPDQGLLNLTFSNGKVLNLHVSELTRPVLDIALLHGLKQKLVDAAAISRNPETGRSATIVDKFAAVEKVYQRLLGGMWNEPREGGGNAGGVLLKALCRLYPAKTPEALREWLDAKSDKEKAALRANPRIAEIIAQIHAEAGKDAPDSDEMLSELG